MQMVKRTRIALIVVLLIVLVGTGVVVFALSSRSHVYIYDLTGSAPTSSFDRLKQSTIGRYASQAVLRLIYSERTRYAPGFNEKAFQSLKPGTAESEVRRALGEPLLKRTFPDGRVVFYYSEQATPHDNYLVRNVVFDAQGRLLAVHAEFYVD
jgi:outer membrane protein assembly factor BamE (lipoprotein component of BamABCDE complex)